MPDGINDDAERQAYNAAFHALGLRWHWDADTWGLLRQCTREPAERVRLYLQNDQPHLLKAYDADFLVAAIEGKKADCCAGVAAGVNWAAMQSGEIGA